MSEVVFPRSADGRRSSAELGRAVVADALRPVDPAAADAAAREGGPADRSDGWRRGYLRHFRALVEAGLRSEHAAYEIASAGLASMRDRMRTADDRSLPEALADDGGGPLETVTVTGSGTPQREVALPYHRDLLRGAALHRQLDDWVRRGTIEESCAEAVREVTANPDWLDLTDLRLVVLGAGAEMGPLPAVLGWGGTVLAVDLPRPDLWRRVHAVAEKSAGRLSGARADLLTDLPAVAQWILRHEGRLVLGDYVYAPGAAYARLAAAVDSLGTYVRDRRPDTAIAKLATPTDVFAVPADAVAMATARYRQRSGRARLANRLSGGRMLRPNYPAAADPGICDSLVAQQGPNYALAKRIQRWRATAGRHDGVVSFSVAPPTRTRSVTSNRLLAAAYAGAHLFDVEVFEPATSSTLMAVLLVHQLRRPRPPGRPAWTDEAFAAAHGGLWRAAYEPRSALPLAAVRGLPTAVRR
ncbi:MAG TPA: hypothetical protein VFH03_22945 [Actinoplanes sp.]|nr:hypothetical protein [Actinoplanes sp.]